MGTISLSKNRTKMKHTENALNILTAMGYDGIGNAWVAKHLNGGEDTDTVVDLLNRTKLKSRPTSVDEFENLKVLKAQALADLEETGCCDGIVALGDVGFSQHRGEVKDSEKPVLLYYKGDIGLLDTENDNVAVIGLLNPKGNIEERERRVVSEFVRQGMVIVSGLAHGCDQIAHEEALERNGKTVAVLPSPLHHILPERNKGLAWKIAEEGGLLVTEYASDFKDPRELNGRYVKRDRLQALFSDAVVLAASYALDSAERWPELQGEKLDSGARLAMGFAEKYGIPRAVMYNQKTDAQNPMFDLNRELMESGAIVLSQKSMSKLVETVRQKKAPAQKKLFG